MRDRIRIWWRLRSLKSHKDMVIKTRFWCTHEGCPVEITALRFLLLGCECRMHRWLRRWGGLES